MKPSFLRNSFLFLLVALLFINCNKESYIETIGSVEITDARETEVGSFIFASKTTVGRCGKITLWIDGKIVGYLTGDYTGTVSSCMVMPEEGKLIKIVSTVGYHTVTATVENKCIIFSTDNYYLKQGICRSYTL